jgi:murein L,D-transpeptidase YafK
MIAAALATVIVLAAAPPEPERVAAARAAKGALVRDLFRQAGAAYPPKHVLLRAFKHEGVLEVWAAVPPAGRSTTLVRVKTYPICAPSGTLGPKRTQGDLQVPEGFYRVSRLNPWSSFHLALGIDYPNDVDRARGQAPYGGDIMIHGACVTVGCIPLTDDGIDEVYVAIQDAGGEAAVHIFPRRLDEAGRRALAAAGDDDTRAFWATLQPGYDLFEATRELPRVRIVKGAYVVAPRR